MPSNPAATIDSFLRGRGSPLEGLGNVFVAAGRKYGVDPRLVVSISGIESSFGKHISGSFNAWGWGPGRPFGSWEEGIQTVTQGLRRGYYDRGLRTPDQIVKRYAPGSDGNDEGNWAKVVNQFMGEMGSVPMATSPKTRTVPSSVPQTPPTLPPGTGIKQAALTNLANVASRGGRADPIGMMLSMAQGFALDQQIAQQLDAAGKKGKAKGAAAPPPPPTVDPNFTPGVPVAALTSVGGAHETSGLGGYPAFDYFAKPGSRAVAPVSGQVVKLSGHDPKLGAVQGAGGPLGWSVYIQGDDGREYFLTHMGKRTVRQGQRVEAGQVIGTVANYDRYGRASHIHMGVRG